VIEQSMTAVMRRFSGCIKGQMSSIPQEAKRLADKHRS
jgi:hypothetical protein